MGTQNTIAYRLVMRNQVMMLTFHFYFLGHFGGKMGMATTRPLTVCGLQAQPKKLAHWVPGDTFGPTARYLEVMFWTFLGPLKLHEQMSSACGETRILTLYLGPTS